MFDIHSKKSLLILMLSLYSIIGALAIGCYIFLSVNGSSQIIVPTAEVSGSESPHDLIFSETMTETKPMLETESISETEAMSETESISETEAMAETESISETEVTTETMSTGYTFLVKLPHKGLNIRSTPNTKSKVLGRLIYHDTGEVIEIGGVWTLIQTADGICGYVLNEYIDVLDEDGKVIPFVS